MMTFWYRLSQICDPVVEVQVRSQVWIWKGRLSNGMGLVCVITGRKRTFLHAFREKVDLFRCFFGEKWTFLRVHWMLGVCSLEKFWKIWLKIMHYETLWSNYIPFQIVTDKMCPKLWTILDTLEQNCGPFGHFGIGGGGCFRTPRTTPWLRACYKPVIQSGNLICDLSFCLVG